MMMVMKKGYDESHVLKSGQNWGLVMLFNQGNITMNLLFISLVDCGSNLYKK